VNAVAERCLSTHADVARCVECRAHMGAGTSEKSCTSCGRCSSLQSMLCVAGRRGTWLVITRAAVKTMFVSDKRGIIQACGHCTCCRAQQSLPAATLQALRCQHGRSRRPPLHPTSGPRRGDKAAWLASACSRRGVFVEQTALLQHRSMPCARKPSTCHTC